MATNSCDTQRRDVALERIPRGLRREAYAYYTIPISMLSLRSLLFATLLQPVEAVDDAPLGQAASA